MAWRIVVQPCGKYARFSDIVDAFTHVNMSREEALEVCREEQGMGVLESEQKVLRAERNPQRWNDELRVIEAVHGKEERASVEGRVQK